ncbi:hypothetical protein DQ04_05431020 [Trypanosoma grayi]|uniref:hypothetical protein n=1 Tax=Trypanosoma grayi TaxID=71804 RepID=UPI0004F47103|nr:hypothetical protein DQ04_05431020 [Trypanosoma grayi]KEG09314.1 hypothetical protein DQ04_05431020 [Trypanosoma grayi]
MSGKEMRRRSRSAWGSLLLLLLLLGWCSTAAVYALELDNDKMVSNIIPQLYVLIFTGPMTDFSVDTFLSKMLEILGTLPSEVFEDASQLELLEYCNWDNLTVNEDSYCRFGGTITTTASHTLVRYGVAVENSPEVGKLDYSSLGAAAGPFTQGTDPALYVPDEEHLTFVRVVMANSVVKTVIGIFFVMFVMILLCGILVCRCLRDRSQEKERSELVRRTMAAAAPQQEQQEQQVDSRNHRELGREFDDVVDGRGREVRWGGTDVTIASSHVSSYWPSSSNVQQQQQQQQQGKEWHEQELAVKPPASGPS